MNTKPNCNNMLPNFNARLKLLSAILFGVASLFSNNSFADNQPPVAICKAKTIGADQNCQVQIAGLALDNGSYDPESGSSISFSYSPAGPFGIGVHTVTMTVSDPQGLSNSCTTTLTVVDATVPELNVKDATIYLDAYGNATLNQSDVVVNYSDYCSNPVSIALSKVSFDCTDAIPVSSVNSPGTIHGKLSADNYFSFYISTDNNQEGVLVGTGNDWATFYEHTATLNANENYFIHVKATDLGGPEFFAGIFTLTGDFHFANGTKTLLTNTSEWQVSSTGWSNYGSPLLVGSPGLQPWGSGLNGLNPAVLIWQGQYNTASGETKYFTAPIYANFTASSVQITATDAAGNSFTAAANVTVVDTLAPLVQTKAHTAYFDANGTATIQTSDVIVAATDNCGNVAISLDQTTFNCSQVGQVNVAYTATDDNGNETKGIVIVSLADSTAPIISTNNINAYLDANGQVTITPSQVDAGTSDNCSLDSVFLSKSTFNCADLGVNTIQFTAQDNGGGPAGTFVRNNINVSSGQGTRFFAADIDGDGDLDLCNGWQIYRNSGNGLSFTGQNLNNTYGQTGGAFADFDNDGDLDVIAFDKIFKNDGSGNFSFYDQINSNYATGGLHAVGDFDEDGDIDIYQPLYYTNGDRVLFNDGTGAFNGADPAQYDVYSAYYSQSAVAADFNGDNHLDVLVGGYHMTLMVGNGTGTFTPVNFTMPNTGNGMIYGYEDYDSDGDLDAVIGMGELYLCTNDGSGNFTFSLIPGASTHTVGAVSPRSHQIADVNSDGQKDVIIANENKMVIMYSNGDGTFSKEENTLPNGVNLSAFVAGDFNGDGYVDIAANPFVFSCCAQAQMYLQETTPPNTSVAELEVTVIDTIAPTVQVNPMTVYLDASGQATVQVSDVLSATDNCSGAVTTTLSKTTFGCSDLGNLTVNYSATDAQNNAKNGTCVIVVADTTKPVAVVNNISVQLDVNGNATISVADIDGGSTDNCGIVNSSISKTTFTCAEGGTTVPVTLSLVDAAGNLRTAVAQVTVLDVMPIVANNDAFNMSTGTSLTFTTADLTGNDVDPYGQPLQVDVVMAPSSGTIVDNYNGTFTFTPASLANHTATATYVVKRNDGTIVFSGNGHFYEFVPAPAISWTNAKIAAENRTYNGMQGYLATVTSASEDAFVAQKLQGEGWIGASDAAVEGVWKWETGPEAGTQFWQGLWYGSVVNGMYNHWAGGEPNNSGNEDYAHYWTNGLWNDYPNQVSAISGYIVEYGGMAGDCNTNSTTTANITFNVVDVTNPTVLAKNVTVYLDANGQASVTAAMIDNGSYDASGIANMTLSNYNFTCGNTGANNVTLTVTDINGNSASANAVVTVVDNIAPTATFVGGNFSLNSNRSYTLNASSLVTNLFDNCGNVTLNIIGQSTFDCDDVDQTFPITVEMIDASGNTNTVSGVVSINDNNSACNNPPVAVCTPGSVPANSNCEALVLAQAFNGGSYDPDGDPITMSISPAGPFGLGTHTIVLTVTDDEGASNSCTTTLTVSDQTGPIVVTQDITVALDASGQAVITPSDVVTSATDNCSGVTLSIDQSTFDCNSVPAVNGIGGPGILTSTLTVDNTFDFYISTDDNVQGTYVGSGSNWSIPYNFSSNLAAGQTYYIHVKATDQGGPEMFLGKFQLSGGFEFANGTQTLVTNGADWQVSNSGWNNYTNPLYLGNIGFGPWGYGLSSMAPAQFIWHGSYNTSGGETKYFSAPIYPVSTGSNVTVTATDDFGNVTTENVVVNVIDNLAPIASVQGITVYLDANGMASITAADIDNNSSDNCGIASYTLDVSSFTCAQAGTTVPVTMTVTDASGNSSSATASVVVVDAVAPVIAMQNHTVYLDANGAGSVSVADVVASTSDACGVASTTIDLSTFDCSNVGTHTVTATVVDIHGNTSTATATVTVVDNVAPTAVCQNFTVNLPVDANAVITASDIDAGSSDACGIASVTVSPSSFDCAAVGDNTVTLTVTDIHGNVSTCQAIVTVVKSPLVVTEVISDYNGFGVSCFGGANGSIDLTVDGACMPYTYSWSHGATTEDVSGLSAGTYDVTVYDGNGDAYNYSYTITEPTLLTSASAMTPYQTVAGQLDSTIFLGYGPQNVTLDVTAAGGAGGYTYQWSPATGLSATNTASVVASPMVPTTYTVIVTDMNGCTTTKTMTVNVVDARDPDNSGKVLLCHLRKKAGVYTWGTISVAVNAVPAHLAHGDYLGECNLDSKFDEGGSEVDAHVFHTSLYPNPTKDFSTLAIHTESATQVAISLVDARGAVIAQIYNGEMIEEMEYEFNINSSELAAGMYNVVIRSNNGVETIRWVVVK